MTDEPTREAVAREPGYLSDDEVLAGAKFYARAYVQRAVRGIIPQNWDDEADEAAWESTPLDRREDMLDMVHGIVVAAEFKRRQAAAADRAQAILAEADRRDGYLPPDEAAQHEDEIRSDAVTEGFERGYSDASSAQRPARQPLSEEDAKRLKVIRHNAMTSAYWRCGIDDVQFLLRLLAAAERPPEPTWDDAVEALRKRDETIEEIVVNALGGLGTAHQHANNILIALADYLVANRPAARKKVK